MTLTVTFALCHFLLVWFIKCKVRFTSVQGCGQIKHDRNNHRNLVYTIVMVIKIKKGAVYHN